MKPRISCAVSNGMSSGGQWPNAVELDPIGVRQPLLAETGGGRRAGEKWGGGSPDDAHRARDPFSVKAPAGRPLAETVIDQGWRRVATRDAEWLVNEHVSA
ncbi:MAG: hypothetical protein M3071_24940 [Actinomycetota bacterium]|nr:hypothetical protein [Actinomycetota bacterium]